MHQVIRSSMIEAKATERREERRLHPYQIPGLLLDVKLNMPKSNRK